MARCSRCSRLCEYRACQWLGYWLGCFGFARFLGGFLNACCCRFHAQYYTKRYDERCKTAAELRADMQHWSTGDIVVMHWPRSPVLTWLTNSPWTHIGMVYRKSDSEFLHCKPNEIEESVRRHKRSVRRSAIPDEHHLEAGLLGLTHDCFIMESVMHDTRNGVDLHRLNESLYVWPNLGEQLHKCKGAYIAHRHLAGPRDDEFYKMVERVWNHHKGEPTAWDNRCDYTASCQCFFDWFCCGYDALGTFCCCCVDRDKNLFPGELVATTYIATGVIKSALTHEGFYHRRAEDYEPRDFMPGAKETSGAAVERQFNTWGDKTWALDPPIVYWDESKRHPLMCWPC